ncbi:hypothetical protein Z949_485 [Sulfitobacter guttiformis KCTC 32187]|uniref:Uncharacterized protein n=1 Tax=Sulfitobacter guttiformis TaxID=74349 RepID=A0A420DUE5_9RHOB|nr:hypothetical protein Z949_485 [Sulfitobacter guttiformis KCTC 32187]RKE97778.1 hypothetical protein C8N30_2405 [Sulfitobacter guttiformis]
MYQAQVYTAQKIPPCSLSVLLSYCKLAAKIIAADGKILGHILRGPLALRQILSTAARGLLHLDFKASLEGISFIVSGTTAGYGRFN